MSLRAFFLAFAMAGVGLVAASTGQASPRLQVGIMDDAYVRGDPDGAFGHFGVLRPEVLRVILWWNEVAPNQPANARDPESYSWGGYDAIVRRASQHNIRVVFTILGTPSWANGGRAWNFAPSAPGLSLKNFAYAAALRYSGFYDPPDTPEIDVLPAVVRWTAWNEPNLPLWLRALPSRLPYLRALARAYKGICNSVWAGVHELGTEKGITERVACGVTAPTKKKSPYSFAPITFLRAIKAAGAKFDVYAHHPHPRNRLQSPSDRPAAGQITLGNIGVLLGELTRLYGKGKRLWLTEYGYQTWPPDPLLGVRPVVQAKYLRQAFAIARRTPRVDMLIWFLLRDEPDLNGSAFGAPGWQSGLFWQAGTRKPSFAAFRDMPH